MKDIRDIEKLSLQDLERIGEDPRIPLPEGWHVQLPQKQGRRWIGIAASVAIVAGIGLALLLRPAPLKDSYDDPYLAFAAMEQALSRMSETLGTGSDALSASELQFEKLNYWK